VLYVAEVEILMSSGTVQRIALGVATLVGLVAWLYFKEGISAFIVVLVTLPYGVAFYALARVKKLRGTWEWRGKKNMYVLATFFVFFFGIFVTFLVVRDVVGEANRKARLVLPVFSFGMAYASLVLGQLATRLEGRTDLDASK
jgi:hypothetical protein